MDPDAYDGFGAPIYPHQEAPMPTNLPDDFKGTGKPGQIQTGDGSWIDIEPNTNDGPNGARNYDGAPLWFVLLCFGLLFVGLYHVGVALLHVALRLIH